MLESEELIQERLPVWGALSEFFLDTELQEDDYLRISEALAASPYSERELKEILRYEVYPPCRLNLMCVAGEWADFGEDWIRQRIVPRYGRRPILKFPMLDWWMVRDHWGRVRELISRKRAAQN